MTSNDLLDLLRSLVTLPAAAFWPAVAWTLDRLQGIGSFWGGLLALALVAASAGLAVLWQRRLVRLIDATPAAPLGFFLFLKLELLYSPVGVPLWLFRLPWMLIRALAAGVRSVTGKLRRKRSDP